jgi:glycosyltransferase involved in cell wall biosynthesis
MAIDVLIVSLASTGGWRTSDPELASSMVRAGARVALVTAAPQRDVRTLALTDLVWARAARAAARRGLEEHNPTAVVYSSTTAALLWPKPGAIRFDMLARDNRPGHHGLWQRPLERRRLAQAPLLVPMTPDQPGLCVPIPVEPSGDAIPPTQRDIAAIAYAADPVKRRLDLLLAAWEAARREGEQLVVAGIDRPDRDGVRFAGRLPREDYRALLRRARAFVAAPRREDYGIAALEALADGCVVATTPASGPYPALGLVRALDPRLVGDDLPAAIRTALDDPPADWQPRALEALAPFRHAAVDRVVAAELLPRLLS